LRANTQCNRGKEKVWGGERSYQSRSTAGGKEKLSAVLGERKPVVPEPRTKKSNTKE